MSIRQKNKTKKHSYERSESKRIVGLGTNICKSNLRKASAASLYRIPNIFEHLRIYSKNIRNIFGIPSTLSIFGKLRTSSAAFVHQYPEHLWSSQNMYSENVSNIFGIQIQRKISRIYSQKWKTDHTVQDHKLLFLIFRQARPDFFRGMNSVVHSPKKSGRVGSCQACRDFCREWTLHFIP